MRIASRSPVSKRQRALSVASACSTPSSSANQRASGMRGTSRASSMLKTPARARSTTRRSMSVPRISVRTPGIASAQTAASVYASAPYEQPALQAVKRTWPANSGRTACRSTFHCSGLRHSCETLIVTRSRNASSSAAEPPRTPTYSSSLVMPRRSANVRMRRSIWPRLYCARSIPQRRRTAVQKAPYSSARRSSVPIAAACDRTVMPHTPLRSPVEAREARARRRRGWPRTPRAACRRRCRWTRPRRGSGRRPP